MYETHFGFSSRPFAATPNADRFFPSENTRRAFDAVVSCVERASGAALVVGSSGLGKSLLLQVIGRHFQQSFSVAILESASLSSRRELLQCILFELGLPYRGMEEGELRLTLMDYLKPSDRCPNGLLLCVDEAHLLPTQLLEEMRMITNLVREGQPRARLVMVGNATIEERLADPKLESLSQRISTRAYLEPMNSSECSAYVAANLKAVGANVSDVFDEASLEAVYIATNGIPRLVNQVCDHALVLATANGQSCVTRELINEAWSDIQRLPVEWHVLGTQSDSKNEHVIEFGSFNETAADSDADCSETHTADDWTGQDSTQLAESSTGHHESHDGEVAAQEELAAQETVAEEETKEEQFVFDGPANPFAEKFEDEELIVDTFSQVIGHSPKKPAFPQTKSEATRPVSVNMDMESDDIAETAEPANRPETLATGAADSETTDEPQATTESSDSPEGPHSLTLDEYLAQSSDAITFGVGQGIYESSFDPIQASESPETPAQSEAPSEIDSEVLGQRESVADANESSSDEIRVASAASGESDAAGSDDSSARENAGTDADHQQLEEKINEVVADLQEDLTRAATSATDEDVSATEAHNKPAEPSDRANDDRDMIIVQEEPQPNPVDTVPIHEAQTSEPSTQAKREDYQQLFDRLRNG